MSKKSKAKLVEKVYIVHTGCRITGEGDTGNFDSYKVIATDAAQAILQVTPKLRKKDGVIEYPESVELVIRLD